MSLTHEASNQSMEPTASRRTIQLSMSSARQSAATRALSLRQLIFISLDRIPVRVINRPSVARYDADVRAQL